MDLKELLGEDFKDGMTVEEIEAAIAQKSFIPSSQLNGKVDKKLFDKLSSELPDAKKANLSTEEAIAVANKEKDDRLAELENKVKLSELTEKFIDGGYDAKTARLLADATVNGDFAKFSEVNSNFLATSKETLKAQIKKELLGESGGAGGDSGGEKDDENNASLKIAEEIGKADANITKSAQETLNYYTGGN